MNFLTFKNDKTICIVTVKGLHRNEQPNCPWGLARSGAIFERSGLRLASGLVRFLETQMGGKNSGSKGSNHGILGVPWGTYSQRNMSEVMQSLLMSA